MLLLAAAAFAGNAARTGDAGAPRAPLAASSAAERGEGGSYREAPLPGVVMLDGETLEGPFRVEARLDRPSRGPASYKVYLVGARQL